MRATKTIIPVSISAGVTPTNIPESKIVTLADDGQHRAHKEGSSRLIAIGDPLCREAHPACAAPSREFRINVVVAGAPKTPAFEVLFAILAIMAALIVTRKW